MGSKTIMTIIMGAVLLPLTAYAGNLEPPGQPSAGSGMPTLTGIYDQLVNGTVSPPAASFQEPATGPTAGTGRTLGEIQGKLPAPDNVHGAATGQVLSGKTFWGLTGGEWGRQTGVMANNGGITITPGTTDQPIAAGYHDGTGRVAGDPALVSSNIPMGVTIFGVAGTRKRPWGCDGGVNHFSEECAYDCESDGLDGSDCADICYNEDFLWNLFDEQLNYTYHTFENYCAR
jgi:hypothetical protein